MITDHVAGIVGAAIERQFKVPFNPDISYPEPQFGDYATNAAFQLASILKKSPQEIAGQLAANINDPLIAEAQAAGGFVNLTMKPEFWIEQLKTVGKDYGKNGLGKGKKVQVEFISANPTGPLTLGNARGGFVGDAVARVLAHSGYSVTREYYFNDAGTQIRTLVDSAKAAAGLIPAEEHHYPGAYIGELAKEYTEVLAGDNFDEQARVLTQAIFERWIKPAIEKMHINYDEWFNEKDLVTGGALGKALERLKAADLTYEKDGALWLSSKKLGDERDRVLIKSNETKDPTYLVNDIPYHLNIFEERGFTKAIKVWGADHAGQVPSLRAVMNMLTSEKQLDFITVQWVRLMQGGQEVKMSKRAGTYVTVDELVDEVGSDVARFFFLMRSVDTPMDFDLTLAKEQSQKNPLYYVMYAYARACSILEQADSRGLSPVSTVSSLSDQEIALIRQMTRFPQQVAEIAADYGVHRLTFFGIETAKLFHDLYERERIIDLDRAIASKKLYVIKQFRLFMEGYFDLVGITPVSQMRD